jgi:hypothetical protein
MKTEEEIIKEIERVSKIKSDAYAHGRWQYGNELNRWIAALEWVLKDEEKKDEL